MLSEPNWTVPSEKSEVPSGSVQIWRLKLNDLGDSPLAILRPLTVPTEHERAHRFRFEEDQHRYLAGRGLTRTILAQQYDCHPQDPSLAEKSGGKPYVEDEFGETSSLHFNIAHTADVVVVALSRRHPVGIDVEPRDRVDDPTELGQRVLTETERQQLRALPTDDQGPFFVHLWTCKEAFLKATGEGLRRAPRTLACTVNDGMVTAIGDAEGHSPSTAELSASRWALRPFMASDGVLGAVTRRHNLPSPLAFVDGHRLIDLRSSP